MSDSSELSTSPRQQIIDAALIAVKKAQRNRGMLSLAAETEKLANRFPGCGMTPEQIRELVTKLAVDRRVDIDFD